jgi:hypothetical protein
LTDEYPSKIHKKTPSFLSWGWFPTWENTR